MTPADDNVLEAPVKRKRVLPRRGRWPAAVTDPYRAAGRHAAAKKPEQKKRRPNPSSALWAKAQAAARSAKLLTDARDWDGTANRAYYAVFSGARAALASVRASLAESKGHGTIVRRLEKHLVGERGLDPDFGRAFFGRLGHVRWLSDYSGVGVEEAAAREMLSEAGRFLAAIEPFARKAKA
jgi:uncharacterized protein (UPF0332 family)